MLRCDTQQYHSSQFTRASRVNPLRSRKRTVKCCQHSAARLRFVSCHLTVWTRPNSARLLTYTAVEFPDACRLERFVELLDHESVGFKSSIHLAFPCDDPSPHGLEVPCAHGERSCVRAPSVVQVPLCRILHCMKAAGSGATSVLSPLSSVDSAYSFSRGACTRRH